LVTSCADHVSEVVRGGGSPDAGEPLPLDCPILPAASPWNQDISAAPVDPLSASYIASMGASLPLVAKFGTDATTGTPYVVIPPDQPLVPITFFKDLESDPGPYPIPADVPIEPSIDGHALIVQNGTCLLYEIYQLTQVAGAWQAYSGALWRLREGGSEIIYWVSMLNPFTHAVEMIRFSLYGMFEPVATAVVVVATIVFFMLATYGYDPQRGMIRRTAQPV